jgi:hypothetical protein
LACGWRSTISGRLFLARLSEKAPFDKIKIDQSFVRGATQPGSRNGAIIASIVSLAEALGMETTEGVETMTNSISCACWDAAMCRGISTNVRCPPRLRPSGWRADGGDAHGPRAARAVRLSLLRRVVLEHGGHNYEATVRNISRTGALIEGLRNVPAGTIFRVHLSDGHLVNATARWCEDDRIGMEFSIAGTRRRGADRCNHRAQSRPSAPTTPAGATVDMPQRRTG